MIRLTFSAIILLTLLGCEIIPMDEYELPEYDGQLKWTQVTEKADWPKRFDHAAVAFNDKLWVFGGYNPGQVSGDTYYEDIWNSSDGENWELINDDAPWLGRRGHKVIVFDDGSGDAMFLLGGFSVNESTGYRQYTNDVWKSTDGVSWQEIKPVTTPDLQDSTDWVPRMNHACLVGNHGGVNYIYIIGGRSQLAGYNARYATVYLNDVWRSTDGINFERLPNTDYGIRSEHAAVADPSTGRIYIQGGTHGIIFETEDRSTHPLPNWHYLWYSDDGIQWQATRDSINIENKYLYRAGHQLVHYNNKIWSFPGKTVSNEHYHFAYEQHFTIWTYEESDFWEIDSKGTVMDPRHSYPTVIFDNKIWVFGGFTDSNAQSNDVWTAQN